MLHIQVKNSCIKFNKKQNIVEMILYLISDCAEFLPFELTYSIALKIYNMIKIREFYYIKGFEKMKKDIIRINKMEKFDPITLLYNDKKKWTRVILLTTIDYMSNNKDIEFQYI
jgi:hypothetical protein